MSYSNSGAQTRGSKVNTNMFSISGMALLGILILLCQCHTIIVHVFSGLYIYIKIDNCPQKFRGCDYASESVLWPCKIEAETTLCMYIISMLKLIITSIKVPMAHLYKPQTLKCM